MSTTSVADPPRMAAPATSPPPDPKVRCEHLVREARVNRAGVVAGPPLYTRCSAEAADDTPEAEIRLCLAHLGQALAMLRRRAADLPDYLTDAKELLAEVNQRIASAARNHHVDILRADEAERKARTDRVIEDLLAPRPAETDTASGTEARKVWVHDRTGIRYCPGTTTAEPAEFLPPGPGGEWSGPPGTCVSCGEPVRLVEADRPARTEAGR